MKRINILEKTRQFNELREALQVDLTKEQIQQALKNAGFGKSLFHILVKYGIITSTKHGVKCVYRFPSTPVYKDKLERCYQVRRDYVNSLNKKGSDLKETSTLSIDEALEVLNNSSEYKVLRARFNESKFREENPELWRKYVEYV